MPARAVSPFLPSLPPPPAASAAPVSALNLSLISSPPCRCVHTQVFVVNPARKVALSILYPATTGRNFDEILRVVDSLHLTQNFAVAVSQKTPPKCRFLLVVLSPF